MKPADMFQRFAGPSGGTCGARWVHPSGFTIIHCGHPTALRPYYIAGPDGLSYYAPDGRAFWRLGHAKARLLELATLNPQPSTLTAYEP